MLPYLLGIISVFLVKHLLKPKPVLFYGSEALDLIGYLEDMEHQYTIIVDGKRHAWDVQDIWIKAESLAPVEWSIPSELRAKWSWGQDHPSDHLERCLTADLSYPIIVCDNRIIDGTHRVIKALAEGKTSIKARVLTKMPPPSEVGELDPIESSEGVHWTHGDMVELVKAVLEYEMMKEYDFRHPLDP